MEENKLNRQQKSPAQGKPPARGTDKNDAFTNNDTKANSENDEWTQGVAGREPDAEYGDVADPAAEKRGTGGRDNASPFTT